MKRYFRSVSPRSPIPRKSEVTGRLFPAKITYVREKENDIEIDDVKEKWIEADDVEAFMIRNGELVKEKYQIQTCKVNEESDELKEIMEIAYNFSSLGMNDKINALETVNLVNYHKSKGKRSA